jgi:hypothetical protein
VFPLLFDRNLTSGCLRFEPNLLPCAAFASASRARPTLRQDAARHQQVRARATCSPRRSGPAPPMNRAAHRSRRPCVRQLASCFSSSFAGH